jgi:hypothetical protein
MAGYYSIRLAEGTHDDLYAKAVVLEKDGVSAALVACDLISVDDRTVSEARKTIQEATRIPATSIMISATHSHTGPLMSQRFLATADAGAVKLAVQYRAALPGKIAEAVRLAHVSLEPARVATATGQESTISFYRRFLMKDGTVRTNPGKMNPEIVQPMGAIDSDVDLVSFTTPEFRMLADYVNFALHLDTVGGTHYSADYPHTLSKLLSKVRGADSLTLFTIGAAGNINHIDVSTKTPQKGHMEAARIGTILAGEVIKATARLEAVEASTIRAASKLVSLPLPRFSEADVTKARGIAETFGKKPGTDPAMVHAMKILDLADRKGKLEAEVQVIALGDKIAWVGLPGEIFVELGVAVKKASPFPQTIVVGLANGTVSYVPTRKAFSEGGYEVTSARCDAGGGEMLAEAAIGLLASLHRSGSSR